jgi:hypothetical protein
LVAAKVDEFFRTQKYSSEKNFQILKKKSRIKVAYLNHILEFYKA